MKTKNRKIKISIFILFAFFSLNLSACGGGGSTGTDPGPGPDPNPDPSGISFDSGTMAPGDSFSYTFDTEGSVNYVCTFHSGMSGSVTVEANGSTTDVTVSVEDNSFSPADVTIGPGTTITWVNNGAVNHTATSQ